MPAPGAVLPITRVGPVAEIPAFNSGGGARGGGSGGANHTLSGAQMRSRTASTRMVMESRMIVRSPSGTLTRGPSFRKPDAPPRWWQSGGPLERGYDSKLVQGVLFLALFVALFAVDLWAIALVPVQHDVGLHATLAAVLGMFVADVVVQSACKRHYIWRFFFWMDLVGVTVGGSASPRRGQRLALLRLASPHLASLAMTSYFRIVFYFYLLTMTRFVSTHPLTPLLLYLYLFATHQVGSASLVMDIPWIVGSFGGGSESDGDGAVLRASRASRVGARAARLTKLIRLVRVRALLATDDW